jgi:hypothetical protein
MQFVLRTSRRFRSMPRPRRLLECECATVVALVVLILLVRDSPGVWQAVALAALGYAVGLTTPAALVLLGWEPRRLQRRRKH